MTSLIFLYWPTMFFKCLPVLQFSGVRNGKLYDHKKLNWHTKLKKNFWTHIVLMAAWPVVEPSQTGTRRWKIKTTHGFLASLHDSCGFVFFVVLKPDAQIIKNDSAWCSNRRLFCSFFCLICSISFKLFIKVLQFPSSGTIKPEKIQRKPAISAATLMKPYEPHWFSYSPVSAGTLHGSKWNDNARNHIFFSELRLNQ